MRINRGTIRLVEQVRTLALHCRNDSSGITKNPLLSLPSDPLSSLSLRFYSKGSLSSFTLNYEIVLLLAVAFCLECLSVLFDA